MTHMSNLPDQLTRDDRGLLDRYLARIGYDGPLAPTLEVLQALQLRHACSIPFENLDPLLARPVPLDDDSVTRKLLSGRRGGYCFEQNRLFTLALQALGFSVTGLIGRVVWNRPEDAIAPRSHQVLLIEIDGIAYIADVGFGSLTPTTPLRLVPDLVQATPHEPMRLLRQGAEFVLQGQTANPPGAPVWRSVYRFDLQPQQAIDYAVSNHYVSTAPDSIFRSNLIVTRVVADGRRVLMNNQLTYYRLSGETTVETFTRAAELRHRLDEVFDLTVPDAAAFDERVRELGFVTG
jgi:N-hydroxyarylamine O-acetyltransferase